MDFKQHLEKLLDAAEKKTKEAAEKLNMTVDEYIEYEKKKIQSYRENDNLIYILRNIPEIYQNANMSKIDKRIISFVNSKKNFCWIHGKPGTGKTYSLYAILINRIYNNDRSKTVKEYQIRFEEKIETIIAIDDLGLSKNENRNRYLLDWYFSLFDYKLEHNEKLYITSNLSISEWIANMKKLNDDTAIRIASRLSNVTDEIELVGEDKRKFVDK